MTTPTSTPEHWDAAYASTPVDRTGWWEETPAVSLQLIERCYLDHDDLILDAGTGASTLLEHLIRRGFRRLIAADISQVALDSLAGRLGPDAPVRFIVADLSKPAPGLPTGEVALWHDRALLHFLVTPDDRAGYVANLRAALGPGGHVVLATFAPDGAEYCSGLPVQRYDASGLAELLGDEFVLEESLHHVYQQPSGGLRPFTYARFRHGTGAP